MSIHIVRIDGRWEAWCKELDISGYGDTLTEAIERLLGLLREQTTCD